MAAIDMGSLIFAPPTLLRGLDAGLCGLAWVLLSCLLAWTALLLVAGRLSEVVARRKLRMLATAGASLVGAAFSALRGSGLSEEAGWC